MSTKQSQQPESFRDSISTVDAKGDRVWLYPKKPSGRYYNARKWLAYVLIGLFFAGPFLKIGGQPLLMFNLFDRKFVLFGYLFVPQDFHIFVLLMILMIVFIVLFTVVYGRVWCGWACPQTVFMEMVFRRIEYWIEGDASKKKKLDKMPWNREKILKKGFKHTLFVLFSLAIANMVLGYIFGGEQLMQMVASSPLENWDIFVAHVAFAGVFYAVFARFREQVCIAVCPYGRLQGVFLDKDSVVISYDHIRGEPRGKLKKGNKKKEEAERKLQLEDVKPQGDCIDCSLCVQVCPTGIDIRNGTQLECINCTACIDACDEVMDKIEKPRGLIRFASANDIEEKKPFKWTIRMLAYTGVLCLLLGAVGFLLGGRSKVETTVLRAPGMTYQVADNGDIRNLYTIQLVNKTHEEIPISVKLIEPAGQLTVAGGDMVIEKEGIYKGAFFIEIDPSLLDGARNTITLEIYSGEELLETIDSRFLGPIK
ncbi:cytochrome c oxidase accessory protein CcoG [Algivirga pacifica]|uniref:Cytochrome c oxidase accessory protein CcoG n=1 Tax=Algivirga pacifica TaxID=1162670 RepID=A0ABP9D656_9BACT